MARRCYLTHAWRPDREVIYVEEAEPGYAYIDALDGRGPRVVPIDSIYFKDDENLSLDDLL